MSDGGARELFDKAIGRAQSAAASLYVRSSLNPMLWLSGIVSPVAFVAAWFMRDIDELSTWLIVIGAIPVLTTCVMFIYMAIFRPESLRSEQYQIRHEAIELIRQKGSKIPVSASSLDALMNPAAKNGEDS